MAQPAEWRESGRCRALMMKGAASRTGPESNRGGGGIPAVVRVFRVNLKPKGRDTERERAGSCDSEEAARTAHVATRTGSGPDM